MKNHLLPLLACATLGSLMLPSPAAPSENGGKTYLRANGKIQTITLPPDGKHEVTL